MLRSHIIFFERMEEDPFSLIEFIISEAKKSVSFDATISILQLYHLIKATTNWAKRNLMRKKIEGRMINTVLQKNFENLKIFPIDQKDSIEFFIEAVKEEFGFLILDSSDLEILETSSSSKDAVVKVEKIQTKHFRFTTTKFLVFKR